ncbi:MAG: cytochrome c4 [Zoogloeaceae bacterium]|jgi:cytochrome c553|nr:cytochrome c4 [Zoogloeaceae bacterium]
MTHFLARTLALPALFSALLGFAPVFAEEAVRPQTGDPQKGKALAESVCVACHGADGNSANSAYPHLAGQVQEYAVSQIKQFKSGARVDPFMTAMAATIATPEDELNVTAWFAQQVLQPVAVKDDETLIPRGQKLWRGGDIAKGIPACAGCHGVSGKGLPAQYPRLAGQFPEYLAAQLQKFRSGERANDPEGMMQTIAGKLSDHDVKAVAEYAAGLR